MAVSHEPSQTDAQAWLRTERRPRGLRILAGGEWTLRNIVTLDSQLRALDCGDASDIDIDGSAITRLDSAGGWLLVRTKRALEEAGKRVGAVVLPEIYAPLIHVIEQEHTAPPVEMVERHTLNAVLERIGRATVEAARQGAGILGFLGRVTVETAEAIYAPRGNLRVAALFHQIEEIGINALPIVGLLAFLIGVVLAYQGVDQLKRVGAQDLTVTILGLSLLRELGGLITAIIVAGRSGSAFTAEIGTMKVNEEIDAMQTIGLNTIDVLVLPRILGLVIVLPLLTFYADVMGLIGGAVMCYFDLGISTPLYMRMLHESISTNTLMVGLIKAPVFAFFIGLVGCYQGMQVERNAASVGKLTTRAVVESVFLVIVLDAGFSVLFSILGI
jgi:phospholipid/cholesterol/gamma-HCH transport system permease protein